MKGDEWHVTGDRWQVTDGMWQVRGDTWHIKHDTWHMTRDTWQITFVWFFGIGANICTCTELQCLPCAGLFFKWLGTPAYTSKMYTEEQICSWTCNYFKLNFCAKIKAKIQHKNYQEQNWANITLYIFCNFLLALNPVLHSFNKFYWVLLRFIW